MDVPALRSLTDLASNMDKIDDCLSDETEEEVKMVPLASKHLLCLICQEGHQK